MPYSSTLQDSPVASIESSPPPLHANSVTPSTDDAASNAASVATSVDDLPRTRLGGKDYIKISLLDSRFPRRSWIWKHGYGVLDYGTKKNISWVCQHCESKKITTVYVAGSTSPAASHLAKEHRLYDLKRHPESEAATENDSSSIHSSGSLQSAVDRIFSGAKKVKTWHPREIAIRFRNALVKWIVVYQVALIAIENQAFRELLAILSKSLSELLPESGNTVRRWIMDLYETRKAQIIHDLRTDAASLIHVSFDLWTSPNSMAMMAVVCHYIDKSDKNRTRLIALRRLRGSHSGENMSELLVEVIREFGFDDRLGYFVADNAESNDIAIDCVFRILIPNLSSDQRSYRRLRCWGHVLNLCANAYLWGHEAESFETEILINSTLAREQAELLSWRKQGPVGKLHNLVVFIRRSPQRRETWQELKSAGEPDLQLIQDNSTRWNSVYLMIQRALAMKDRILLFMIRNEEEKDAKKRLADEDKLTLEDWRIISETSAILAPFYDQTKRLQSRAVNGTHGSIWEAFPSMEYLLSHIICTKEAVEVDYAVPEKGPDDKSTARSRQHIKTSLDNCHGKLDCYYQLLDMTPVYSASVVLHPGLKWRFFERQWNAPHKHVWLTEAKKCVKKFWEMSYKNQTGDTPDNDGQDIQAGIENSRRREPDALDQFLNPPDFYDGPASRATRDEYKDYCNEPPERCDNPLQWWGLNRTKYPCLSRMAMDILSIPLMSAECERVFSSTKMMVTGHRNAVKEDIVEACTVLRYYYQEDGIEES